MGASGVAQVVENLYSKCEALSSNPSTTKKQQKKGTEHGNKPMLISFYQNKY
jgi:hypothetical protein